MRDNGGLIGALTRRPKLISNGRSELSTASAWSALIAGSLAWSLGAAACATGSGDGIETRGGAAVDAWGGGAWGGACWGAGCAAGTPCGGVFAENGLGA